MKLYLNDKLLSIQVINDLNTLLTDYIKRDLYPNDPDKQAAVKPIENIDQLKDISPVIDYVKEFLEYFFEESGTQVDKVTIGYINNLLYAAKGAPEIFRVMNDHLGLNISYDYEFPVIKVLDIEELRVSDINLFVKKLKLAIYHLLFYTKLLIIIQNLIIRITGELTDYSTYWVKPYKIIKPTIL